MKKSHYLIDRHAELREKLRKNLKNRPCPMCKKNSWTTSGNVFELREFHGESIFLDPIDLLGNFLINISTSEERSIIYPIIPVCCNNCGNTVMINAIQLKRQ